MILKGPLINPFFHTVPTFSVRETNVSRHNGGARGSPIMPRDVSGTVGMNGLIVLKVNNVHYTQEKSSQNLVKLNQIWIVITFLLLIWRQADIRQVPNQ